MEQERSAVPFVSPVPPTDTLQLTGRVTEKVSGTFSIRKAVRSAETPGFYARQNDSAWKQLSAPAVALEKHPKKGS